MISCYISDFCFFDSPSCSQRSLLRVFPAGANLQFVPCFSKEKTSILSICTPITNRRELGVTELIFSTKKYFQVPIRIIINCYYCLFGLDRRKTFSRVSTFRKADGNRKLKRPGRNPFCPA